MRACPPRSAPARAAVLAVALLAVAATIASGPRAGGGACVSLAMAATPAPATRATRTTARPRGARPAATAAYDSTRGDSVGEAALYLSWGAPYGAPGARQNLDISCRDTSRVDTLYLSLELGRDLPRLHALFGRIYFHPAPGDTLGSFWQFGSGGANRGSLLVQMDVDGTFPCAQPWLRPGMGVVRYDFAPQRGELQLIYGVRPDDAPPVSGRTRYCFARLLVKHQRCGLDGAGQAVCVEWAEAIYSGGGDDLTIRRGPGRFVAMNAPGGGVCASPRRARRISPWLPPGWTSPGAAPLPADSLRR